MGRGFSLSHQKVALEVAVSGPTIASGYTELTITPTVANLKTIHLNSRQTEIHRVVCAGREADFSIVDHLSSATLSNPRDVHSYPDLKRKLFAATSDGSGGELSILLPPDVHISQQAGSDDFAPIVVRIYYSIRSPAREAIQVVLPTEEAPHRTRHMFTSPTCADFARCWVPCVDSLWERCTWELQFVIAKRWVDEEQDNVVVGSGELVEQVAHPHNSAKTIFYFTQPVATSVQHIAFAAGPFSLYKVPRVGSGPGSAAAAAAMTMTMAAAAEEQEQEQVTTAFCLPGREEELRNSVGVLPQAIDYFSKDFGSYPFASFNVVFVDDGLQDTHIASTLALFSAALLYPSTVIDQAFETRQLLSHAAAFQWIGINIVQRSWADTWLVHGLSLYITGLFMRRLLGNNEYRFRLKKDCDRLCACDVGMPPLYQLGTSEPPDESMLAFVNLKAPLVLYILDRRLCKAGASLGLGRVIPKVFLQAITGELVNGALSTGSFLRTCRKVSGIELRTFADQWIFGSGCPRFYCSASFNKKKLLIEFHISQESPSFQFAASRPAEAAGCNAVQTFEGQMTVRIHEPDGTPYEHVFDLNAPSKRFEVPFNTKYKRIRRNTKRFKTRQALAAAAAEGDEGAAEDMTIMDLGFGLGMWEDEEQREKWKVADWTARDEEIMSSAPLEWIRLDADFEWIATIYFDQPDFMWVSQLQRDRDVVAQVAAVEALAKIPSAIASSMLTRTVLVSKYFFRVRIAAIDALVGCALAPLDYLGLFHLLMLFRTRYCHELSPGGASSSNNSSNNADGSSGNNTIDMDCIPRANNFADFSDYFLKRALIHAIARVRNQRGRTLPQVKRFLINLLRYNDNSTNKFGDDVYVAGLIESLAQALVPLDSVAHGGFVPAAEDPDAADDEALLLAARQQVDRFQGLDRLVPSYHNVVTLSCLDFQGSLMLSNMLAVDLPLFLGYTRQGNFHPVRVAAFDYLVLLRGLQHKVLTRYIFAVLQTDESRAVKRHVARAVCEALAVSVALGEFGGGAGGGGASAESQVDAMLRAIRKEVGRSAAVREGFMAALLSPRVDAQQRWALLKLGDLLFRPAEETEIPYQPKVSVRVRMPSQAAVGTATTTTVEGAAPAPTKIRLVRPSVDETAAARSVAFVDESANGAVGEPAAATSKTVTPPKKKSKSAAAAAAAAAAAKPGQASGMSTTDLTACRNCLKRLLASRHAHLFRNPVDPVRDKAPDYFRVISSPMDLSSMSNKLDAGLYRDRFEFKADFELLVSNAKTYTPDTKAYVHQAAVQLERDFNAQWTRITKTLEQTAARQQAGAAPAAAASAAEQASPKAPAKAAPTATAASPVVPVATPATPAAKTAEDKARPAAAPPSTGLGGIKIKLKRKDKPQDESPAPPAKKPAPSPASPSPKPPTPKSVASKAAATSKLAAGKPATATAASPKATPAPPSSSSSSTPAPAAAAAAAAAAATPIPDDQDPVAAARGRPIHAKRCKGVLAALRKLPQAAIFLKPVDPILDGAPTYYDEIKAPMDLATMETKLQAGSYKTMADFAADVLLIVANCRQYNPPTTMPRDMADAFGAAFRREWAAALVRRLDYHEQRALQGLVGRLKSNQYAGLFLEAVDPVKLGIPTYFDVVRPEDARDLSLIEAKVKSSAYDSLEAFDADVRLMLDNCYRFNAADEGVTAWAKNFEKAYGREWKDLKAKFGLGPEGAAATAAGASSKKKK
ncbi:hypothetical protein FA10DRAFT_276691 [Acaromyces ingoldii]|uniref:Transcription initiation factor TFIID subunit 2 n=1 Tax=Acaromyces ingoldii TaxID=215250 RepID=A0A316YSW5_9BASI|nr:hypothetical protein FA10DRAFT_276691 [Acaromyces ingoldii]PWN92640.1 hypothetical protein FA10DRAFT_276691 [Acaromyces ingoldii]